MKKTKEPKNLLTDEDLKPENIKANITIRVSGELLRRISEIYKFGARDWT